jgi:putative endonuclease
MYYVYLLRSERDKKLYIGYSGNLKNRIKEHFKGKVEATKSRLPVKLIYYEAYKEDGSARKRELQLKKFGSSYKGLVKRIGIEK